MYWFCDYQCTGNGFLPRHMICEDLRIFDAIKNECILPNLIKSIKRKHETFIIDKYFSCVDKKIGKYPDELNCQIYHLCLPKSLAPFNELILICPKNTAYNSMTQTCNENVLSDVVYKQDLNEIFCKNEQKQMINCEEYYLCFNNQVFKMTCPSFYQFNSELLICQPKAIVKC